MDFKQIVAAHKEEASRSQGVTMHEGHPLVREAALIEMVRECVPYIKDFIATSELNGDGMMPETMKARILLKKLEET